MTRRRIQNQMQPQGQAKFDDRGFSNHHSDGGYDDIHAGADLHGAA